MKNILKYNILVLLLSFSTEYAFAQSQLNCGEPPPVANESLKGSIRGEARLLSKFLGDAQLAGKVETSKKEIFSKYPDANTAMNDAYFRYVMCEEIKNDPTKNHSEKLEDFKKMYNLFKKDAGTSNDSLSEIHQLTLYNLRLNYCENKYNRENGKGSFRFTSLKEPEFLGGGDCFCGEYYEASDKHPRICSRSGAFLNDSAQTGVTPNHLLPFLLD